MTRKFETYTFSNSKFFADRGPRYGVAEPITERINPHSKPIVSYYAPKGVGEHHFGERHPMKPHRMSLTNSLVVGYGLDKKIHHWYNPRPATREELETYHDPIYIDFLSKVTPNNAEQMKNMIDQFNCIEDNPIFADMYDFSRMYAGGSLAGARKLCAGTTDIAINWSGGLHHAKRGEASGFCFVNDIVISILEMLKYYPRVMYIDIDIHHGDGVEFAFYHTNRVMTVSFHKYTGEFFPGTGKLEDNGAGMGKHFALNVPLKDGIDDDMYIVLFKQVINDAVDHFKPSAIVLQCGADSLGLDRLGAFNLSIAAHGECVNHVRAYNVPLLVLGGGGYTVRNVARCWTYETAVLTGTRVQNELPMTVYDSHFADSNYKLHPILIGRVENQNTAGSLQRIMISIREKLRYLSHAPSVGMQELPPGLDEWLAEETKSPNEREEEQGTATAGDIRREDRTMANNEFFDAEVDVDQDDSMSVDMPLPPKDVPITSSRGRGRGGRRPRGRGRGGRARGRAASASASKVARYAEEGESDESQSESSDPDPAPAKRARGRGGRARGRVRGRGRGRAHKTPDEVPDDVSDEETDAQEASRMEERSMKELAAEKNGVRDNGEVEDEAMDYDMQPVAR